MLREWVVSANKAVEGLQWQNCDSYEPQASEIRLRIEAFALK